MPRSMPLTKNKTVRIHDEEGKEKEILVCLYLIRFDLILSYKYPRINMCWIDAG